MTSVKSDLPVETLISAICGLPAERVISVIRGIPLTSVINFELVDSYLVSITFVTCKTEKMVI